MRGRWAAFALILAWGLPLPGTAAVPMAQDLRAAAAGGVVLVVFTLAGCPYCERALRDHIAPMSLDPRYRQVGFVEVRIDGAEPLTDFAGRATRHADFARGAGARFGPTVKVYLADGREAAEPVVGLTLPDFYGAYLDRAVETALAARAGSRP